MFSKGLLVSFCFSSSMKFLFAGSFSLPQAKPEKIREICEDLHVAIYYLPAACKMTVDELFQKVCQLTFWQDWTRNPRLAWNIHLAL
jgi:hypothetical protein